MVENLAALEALDAAINQHDSSSSNESKNPSKPITAKMNGITSPEANSKSPENSPKNIDSSPTKKGVAHELELIFRRDTGLTAGTMVKDINIGAAEILKNVAASKNDSAASSPSMTNKKKVYASVAEMKRSKVKHFKYRYISIFYTVHGKLGLD